MATLAYYDHVMLEIIRFLKSVIRQLYMEWASKTCTAICYILCLPLPDEKGISEWVYKVWEDINPECVRSTFEHSSYAVSSVVRPDTLFPSTSFPYINQSDYDRFNGHDTVDID